MEVISMQNSSNPNSVGPSKPPKRFLKKGLLTFATCMALADEVFAQSTNLSVAQTTSSRGLASVVTDSRGAVCRRICRDQRQRQGDQSIDEGPSAGLKTRD